MRIQEEIRHGFKDWSAGEEGEYPIDIYYEYYREYGLGRCFVTTIDYACAFEVTIEELKDAVLDDLRDCDFTETIYNYSNHE
jgi:hypothetical protein